MHTHNPLVIFEHILLTDCEAWDARHKQKKDKITKQTFHFQTSFWQASVSTWAQVKTPERFQITCFIKQISAI